MLAGHAPTPPASRASPWRPSTFLCEGLPLIISSVTAAKPASRPTNWFTHLVAGLLQAAREVPGRGAGAADGRGACYYTSGRFPRGGRQREARRPAVGENHCRNSRARPSSFSSATKPKLSLRLLAERERQARTRAASAAAARDEARRRVAMSKSVERAAATRSAVSLSMRWQGLVLPITGARCGRRTARASIGESGAPSSRRGVDGDRSRVLGERGAPAESNGERPRRHAIELIS